MVMRKIILVTFVVAMFGITQSNAQGLVKNLMGRMYGGVKVEANTSNFFLSDMDGMSSKMNIGGSAGGFLGLRVSERFSIQEDFLMYYQTSQLERNEQKGDFSYLGAECTLYAMGNWKISGSNRLSVGVGPFVGYGLNAKYKIDGIETDLYEKDNNGDKTFQPFSAGVAAILGYELRCGLQFNISYKVGVIDQLDANKDNASMLPSRISMGVAYRFGK